MNNKEAIKEINQHAKDSLEEWSNVFVDADIKGWGVYLDFDDEDLLNVLLMFNSVWSNIAIKRGILTEENVEKRINDFSRYLEEIFGINTVDLANKVLDKRRIELN